MIEMNKQEVEKAILVGVKMPGTTSEMMEDHLSELELLADTAGAETILKMVQERNRPEPAFFIGKGKAEELKQLVELNEVNLVIFDDDLSPSQTRNLEKLIEKKILDRSGLILDIFAAHAQTNESKLQVELAQLQYMLPRLTRMWTHLSKQFGGIGTKGPGETQIETDRRIIRTRISRLKEKLRKIESQQQTAAGGRKDFIKASLVGYTNAGKSTLLNLLTGSDVLSEDKLFATLDSTTRAYDLTKNKKVLLSDTVGFIRKLPPHLVASFKSTLNVVRDADIILHVVDVTHPFFEEHIDVTDETLKDLKCKDKPQIKIFNKVDKLEDKDRLSYVLNKYENSVAISAFKGMNIGRVQEMLQIEYDRTHQENTAKIHAGNSKLISFIHANAEVLSVNYNEDIAEITYTADTENFNKIQRLLDEEN